MELSLDSCWVSSLNPSDKISDRFEPASLLADDDELSSISILGANDNSSIRHNSVPDHVSTPTESGIENISISEIGINQDSIIKTTDSSSTEKSSSSIHMTQGGASEIDLMQTTPVQIDRLHVGISDSGFLQEGLYQNSASQVSVSQTSPTQVNIPQTNSFEIDGIFGEKTFGLEQLNSSKISLPVTITDDQFFSGDFPNHNSTPKIINMNFRTCMGLLMATQDCYLECFFPCPELTLNQFAK
jgi:hypothetical protein